MKKLVVVESPSKTKKIASFLGKDFEVMSSVGHIRDLPKSALGVDVDNHYQPEYILDKGKSDVVNALKKAAKNSSEIYLATDEDREGEAIAWHVGFAINNNAYPVEDSKIKDKNANYLLATKLKNSDGTSPKVYRVTFNSITKDAVLDGFKHPRKLDQNLVNAQQARRILDRLVGYKLSPVLWEKIRYGLSAGRVQSVAVRFIVEREREIKNFADAPYYEFEADFSVGKGKDFKAKLTAIGNKSIYIKKDFDLFAGKYTTYITSIDEKHHAEDLNTKLPTYNYKISKIDKKESKSHPSAPFSTSSLQQSASTNLGYTPQRTMQLAQKLYEGGYITYMRTDSVHLDPAIVKDIRAYVKKEFGEKYLNSSVREYKSKKEIKTQEAHEAIRPADISVHPEQLPKSVIPQQKKLYELIWSRTIASQMASAVYDNMKVQVENTSGEKIYLFEANGSIRKFDGYLKVNQGGKKDVLLPDLSLNQEAKLEELEMIANQMTPPPRYNESSLVKVLESFGIGRPSTYASIVSTIQSRGYVRKIERALAPTDNGLVVNDLLANHFPSVVDVNFTSKMEDGLDEVAIGNKEWVKLMDDFYPEFAELVAQKKKEIKKEDIVILERTEEECPECKVGHLQIKLGKYGRFYSCDRFPDCKYMKGIETEEEGAEEVADQAELTTPCPECGGKLVYKVGRYGKFIACENYPKCKYTQQILKKVGVKCPKCGETDDGEVVVKKTKRNRIFFCCSRYPACDYASWTKPGEEGAESDGKTKGKAKRKAKRTAKRKSK